MDRLLIESLVTSCATQLRIARDQLAEIDQRIADCRAALEDSRLRALASETPRSGTPVVEGDLQLKLLLARREMMASAVVELCAVEERLRKQLSAA